MENSRNSAVLQLIAQSPIELVNDSIIISDSAPDQTLMK